jgi:hypothetical protein
MRLVRLLLLIGCQAATNMIFADVMAVANAGACSDTSNASPTATASCASGTGTTDTLPMLGNEIWHYKCGRDFRCFQSNFVYCSDFGIC